MEMDLGVMVVILTRVGTYVCGYQRKMIVFLQNMRLVGPLW